jgi:hypothetical protein
MKKKIRYIIIALVLIGLVYFFYNMYIFANGVQEDAKKQQTITFVKTIKPS